VADVWRFRRLISSCPRRIFAERLPAFVAPHARKNHGLRQALEWAGFASGGEAGARLAGQLGVSVRTVQRWQKEGGEARAIARATPGLRISVQGIATAQQRQANARAFRERVQEQGLDVGACRVLVLVYNEDRARPRSIGPQHIDGANEGLIDALDALEDGNATAATEAFGHA